MKDIRKAVLSLQKQIDKEGWTIDVHTKTLALLELVKKLK